MGTGPAAKSRMACTPPPVGSSAVGAQVMAPPWRCHGRGDGCPCRHDFPCPPAPSSAAVTSFRSPGRPRTRQLRLVPREYGVGTSPAYWNAITRHHDVRHRWAVGRVEHVRLLTDSTYTLHLREGRYDDVSGVDHGQLDHQRQPLPFNPQYFSPNADSVTTPLRSPPHDPFRQLTLTIKNRRDNGPDVHGKRDEREPGLGREERLGSGGS
jgi:hypothetical protein